MVFPKGRGQAFSLFRNSFPIENAKGRGEVLCLQAFLARKEGKGGEHPDEK